MKIVIMQPYFLPYLGYFQLVAKADVFVFLDDVDFIAGGWLNRNRMIVNGDEHRFTLPLANGRRGVSIKDLAFAQDFPKWRRRFLKTVYHSYHRSPFFEANFERLKNWLEAPENSLSLLNQGILKELCALFGLQPQWHVASHDYGSTTLSGVDRLCEICRSEKATFYINAPGGRSLYSASSFHSVGCTLQFLEPRLSPYPQAHDPFIPGLSILDMLMVIPLETLARRVQEGALTEA